MFQTSLDTRARTDASTSTSTSTSTGTSAAPIEADPLVQLYRWMLLSRQLDTAKADLVTRGEAFFHISGLGHEGMAVFALHLAPADWLHLHYRDQALALARGVPPSAYLNSVLCNSQSYCQGRQMSAMLSWRPVNILSTTTSVGNSALQAVGVAIEIRDRPERPIVLCSLGDGTSQQGEVMEAIAHAARSDLPVLFVIEDNGYSISTSTAGRTFYSAARGTEPESFFGLPIHRLDGRDVVPCHRQLGPIIDAMRASRRSAIVVFRVERLADHSNADDERVYRSEENRRAAHETGDPIQHLSLRLLGRGTPPTTLEAIEESVRAEVMAAVEESLVVEQPRTVLDAKAELPADLTSAAGEFRGNDSAPAGADLSATNGKSRLTMLEAVREVLRARLASDPRVCLFGEDIEDPKGDVFGVTRGLSTAFPGRVVNSPLSEATIVGVSIGRALAGGRPVALLQFADFLPVTLNQIMSELSTMYWRSVGEWNCPVVILAPCGGYRPGLGPFHSQTMESIAAHMPGIDVFMPSTAADAAGLLNAALKSPRPTLFLYPKVCLNDRNTTASADVERHFVPIGKARHLTRGDHLTIAAWGSTVQLCEKAAAALADAGLAVDLIDLRSITPWDREAVVESAGRTGKLLVVHEDNLTCGFGAEVVATVCESLSQRIVARRLARPDTYTPCNFSNQLEVLPSFKRILSAAAELLDLDLTWTLPTNATDGLYVVEAMGASPADQSITIVEWAVAPGQRIAAGDHLAVVEADKAVTDLSAPVSGIVGRLLMSPGESALIGKPIAEIIPESKNRRQRQITREESGTPLLRRRTQSTPARESAASIGSLVGMSLPYAALGSRLVTNEELLPRFPGKTAVDIVRGTGIRVRRWLGEGQTMLSMLMQAVRAALAGEGLEPHDLGLIVCSTSTPPFATPTTACLVLNELSKQGPALEIPAYDLSAACTGYLYALASAHDFLRTKPDAKALVLTAEAMSRVVDPADFDSAILFGDAASATILYGQSSIGRSRALLRRPVLSAKGEDGTALSVPAAGWGGYLKMNGKKVFSEAVKQMVAILKRACGEAGLAPGDLNLVVPHQANARIVEAVRQRAGVGKDRMVNDIGQLGNTSSSTIPLCLEHLLDKQPAGSKIGLCAFGAGFTMGAGIVELPVDVRAAA